MKYVQALKPEKHNGGAFFEHEIHFKVPAEQFRQTYSQALRQKIEEFITENIGSKHTDFRVSVQMSWARADGFYGKSDAIAVVKVRFADKNKALRFKLSWPH